MIAGGTCSNVHDIIVCHPVPSAYRVYVNQNHEDANGRVCLLQTDLANGLDAVQHNLNTAVLQGQEAGQGKDDTSM